jgi:N-acetylmuramoyl-L-alanine amidase
VRKSWQSGAAGIILAGLLAGCASAVAGGTAPRTGSGTNPSGSPGAAVTAPVSSSPASVTPGGASPADAGSVTTSPATAAPPPLAGKTIGIDPGHDGGNFDAPDYIDRQVWNGMEYENCDTTGTQTASGYTEARFNFSVASYLRRDLTALGARVVMTRHSNSGVGPCVTRRAAIINRAQANVAIDIHADGGPPSGRGFTVLEPVADGPNDKVIGASVRFGHDVRSALLKYTSMPESDYYGRDGLIFRDDLAGLNLTTVPKVLVECGNMQNPVDARLLTIPSFQRRLARAFTAAIVAFLTGSGRQLRPA